MESAKDAIVSITAIKPGSIYPGNAPGVGAASGFIVDTERRLIVTNRHVTGVGPVKLEVNFNNTSSSSAVAVYVDPWNDFAIIQYESCEKCKALKLGKFQGVKVGDEVATISNDAMMKNTIITGNVLNTKLDGGFRQSSVFQTSMNISPGSSGSPVMLRSGEVIGVNFATPKSSSTSIAVISDYLIDKLGEIRTGRVMRGDIGYQVGYLTRREAPAYGFKPELDQTLYVTGQVPGYNDLLLGDIIIEVDGKKVSDIYLYERMIDLNMGKAVPVKVWRKERFLTINVNVEKADIPKEYLSFAGGNFIEPDLFMALSLGVDKGKALMLAHVEAGSMFKGLVREKSETGYYCLLLKINDQPVSSLDGMERVLKTIKGSEILKFEIIDRGAGENIPRHVFVRWSQAEGWKRVGNRSNFDPIPSVAPARS
ncbi:MAG: trypsin-like peptidase domain-containing protein [Pseudobdellovibrionaceae bacterium]|nr:trypsin-like peptidase domain-containing protein [Pseudobdellovibrionaceae bacterium]